MLSRLLALLAALVAYAPVLRYGFLISSSICANVSYIYGATSQPSEYPVPAPHEMCDIHGARSTRSARGLRPSASLSEYSRLRSPGVKIGFPGSLIILIFI